MTALVQRTAELLADFFLALMRPQKHGKWIFNRGSDLVIVTVEVISEEAMKEYETATAAWKMPEESVVVS